MLTSQIAPVAIGGVGGSGTRLVAGILQRSGVFIGADLNDANDNLWFTLLFKRREVMGASEREFSELLSIFEAAMTRTRALSQREVDWVNQLSASDRIQHSADWLKKRAESIQLARHITGQPARWGWKEPNTHIVIDRVTDRMDGMKYIHVARNGLDIAHSGNQSQLENWGPLFLDDDFNTTPRHSLTFWRRAHERVLKIGERLGERFLFIRFEELCAAPEVHIEQLLKFADIEPTTQLVERAAQLVEVPTSIGRYKQHPLDVFDAADVEFVGNIGFDTTP